MYNLVLHREKILTMLNFNSLIVPFDLGFLVDGSKHVGRRNFKLLMQFVKYIYKPFAVSRKGVHVGLVVFTSNGKLQFGFKDHFSQRALDKAVNQVSFPGERGHSLGEAVTDTKRVLFAESGRKNVRKALVTIVVGKSDDDISSAATSLKTDGIRSVVVGMKKNDAKQIETLATSSTHYYINLVYESLAATIDGVIQKIGKHDLISYSKSHSYLAVF